MARKRVGTLTLEGAELLWGTNFRGLGNDYNALGERNFNVAIKDPDLVDALRADGWRIKEYSKDPSEEPIYYIKAKVSYKYSEMAPKIYMRAETERRWILLNESTVGVLDKADIRNIDLVLRPYFPKKLNGEQGNPFVDTMYVIIADEPLANKYAGEEFPEEEASYY